MNFHTTSLFKQSSVLKFQHKICLKNILFVRKSVNNLTPVLTTWFGFASDQHKYETSILWQANPIKSSYKTKGRYVVIASA